MHIHTNPKSPCSNLTPESAIKEAIDIGLDGIVFTEHNITWTNEEINKLREKYDIIILKGIEITAREGDILVYNYDFGEIADLPYVKDIRNIVGNNPNVFIAWAHPFREFLVVGISDLGIDMDEILNREIFKYIDGIEVLNGLVSKRANRLAKSVCKKKNLICISGSDAHELDQIGRCVMNFKNKIHNELELVKNLFKGEFEIEYFRK